MPHPQPILRRLRRLFYDPHGKLTEELAREQALDELGQLPKRRLPTRLTTSVCGYCSTGCRLSFHVQGDRVVNLSPDRHYVVNRGAACPKGWEALTPLDAHDRLRAPMLRRGNALSAVTWDEALSVFTTRMKALKERHGGDCLAFLGTGQLPTEELAFLGALARFGLGFAHGDGNTRQCMATAVTAYKQAFGFDAPPYTYADLEESDVLVFVGANPAIAHPILWQRVMRSRRSPEIVVVDPRRTETASCATLHLPLAPKSDLTLFYAVARWLIERGTIDREYIEAHTRGFDDFAEHVRGFDLPTAASQTGLPPRHIERLAELIGSGRRVSFWWTMGVNQSHQGVSLAHALIGLALMTGNIGKPGTGANSITGQCNAMGSRLFSNTSSLFGGRELQNPEHRRQVAEILDLPADSIPTETGLAYDQIVEGIFRGRIKGLWVIATNSASSWINQADAREALSRLEFLVVQDMYHSTATAELAHLLLPAAGWGEKSGTFINSERRIGVIIPRE